MRVRLKELAPGALIALLVELLDPPVDAELAAVAAERAEQERIREAEQAGAGPEGEPGDLDDARFGRLRWDAARSQWTAEVRWSRRPVKLVLARAAQTEAEAALRVARDLFAHQKLWAARLRELLDTQVLDLLNGTWLGEGERPFTARRFRTRIRLHLIEAFADGRFEFWFSDDDLFGGHDVRVTGRLSTTSLEFSLVG